MRVRAMNCTSAGRSWPACPPQELGGRAGRSRPRSRRCGLPVDVADVSGMGDEAAEVRPLLADEAGLGVAAGAQVEQIAAVGIADRQPVHPGTAGQAALWSAAGRYGIDVPGQVQGLEVGGVVEIRAQALEEDLLVRTPGIVVHRSNREAELDHLRAFGIHGCAGELW